MIKTVIFDMDGVIIDTEPVHYRAYHQHFKALEIDVKPELYSTFTGASTKNVYSKLKEEFNLPHELTELMAAKRMIFNDAFDTKEDLFLLDGLETLIKDLHKNGLQLVLASSAAKFTIHKVFSRFELYPYFTHIVSGEDFTKSKPDPSIFLEAVRLSGSKNSECVVIEDSTNGIKAANAAGIFCIGYVSVHSKLQNLSFANMVIHHFNELNAENVKHLSFATS